MLPRLLAFLGELSPNRHFLKLWASQVLSLVAFNMVNFTLLIHVYELTSSSTLVSLFVLSFGLPSLLFGAVAGVFADRWRRRRTLIVTNALRAVIVLVFLVTLDSLPAIYAATFAMATVTQFFTPAEGAAIPELVDRKRLVGANAIFMVTMFATFVVGYGAAGPLAALGGDTLPILLAAGMFALATVFCARLPALGGGSTHVGLRLAYAGVAGQLREGLQAVRRDVFVRYGLWQLTIVWTVIGVVMVVLPAFTAEVLGLNLREVGRLLVIPIGIGMLFGGYLLHRARRHFRLRNITLTCLTIAGLGVLLLGQVNSAADTLTNLSLGVGRDALVQTLTSVSATILGLTLSMVMIAAQTLIHEHTPAAIRGRVFGVLGMSINAANTVPVLLAGAITDLLSVSAVVSAVGIGLVAWAVVSRLRYGGRPPLLTRLG